MIVILLAQYQQSPESLPTAELEDHPHSQSLPSNKLGGLKSGIPTPGPGERLNVANTGEIDSACLCTAPPSGLVKEKAKLKNDRDYLLEAPDRPESKDSKGPDLLEKFTTSNQAISKSFLKEIMLVLSSSLHKHFTETINKFTTSIDGIGERVNSLKYELERLYSQISKIEVAGITSNFMVSESRFLMQNFAFICNRSLKKILPPALNKI